MADIEFVDDVKFEIDYVTTLMKVRAVIMDSLYKDEDHKEGESVWIHYLHNATFHSKVDKLVSEIMTAIESCNLK